MTVEQYCQSVDHRPRKATYKVEGAILIYMCEECFEKNKEANKSRIVVKMQSRQSREMEFVI